MSENSTQNASDTANQCTEKPDDVVVHEIKDPNSGILLKKITTKNGVPHGETIVYDNNGNITSKVNFENGKLSGAAEFFISTKPVMFTSFKEGLQDGETTFFSNGIKSGVVNLKKGAFDGKFISFDNAGNIIREALYVNGQQNGESNTFYPDGTLMESAVYKNSVIDGEQIRYFPNGKVMEISTFEDGKPVGFVDTYDQKGNLVLRKEV